MFSGIFRRHNRLSSRPGFTLIELLVVVSIIVILSAIGLSTFINARRKSIDAQYKATVKQIQVAAEQAYLNDSTSPLSYQAGTAVEALLEEGKMPANFVYSLSGNPWMNYCIMSPALNDITAGNCSTCASGIANFGSATTNFCAKNLQ